MTTLADIDAEIALVNASIARTLQAVEMGKGHRRELEGEISQRENAVMPTLRNPDEVATELGDALRALLLDKSNRRKAATFLDRVGGG